MKQEYLQCGIDINYRVDLSIYNRTEGKTIGVSHVSVGGSNKTTSAKLKLYYR